MSDTIKEDKEGHFGNFVSTKGLSQQADENGNISKAVLEDLKEFKREELLNLEENLKNARLPTEDLFGIKRRFCTVCDQGCNGYEPNTQLIPQPGEFPTFCKNCKCPAHFHKVCLLPEDIVFPEGLKETIQTHSISSKDLNFNCIIMAYQIRDLHKKGQNMQELVTILKEEGMEVISVDTRHLEIEEAIYLKSRMVGQTENLVYNDLGWTQGQRQNGIHHSSSIGKHGSIDPFQLNQNADLKEARLIHKTQKMTDQHQSQHLEHIAGVSTMRVQKLQPPPSTLTENNVASFQRGRDTLNQRVPLTEIGVGAPSIVRTSIASQNHMNDLDHQILEESMNLVRRETIVPAEKNKTFKVRSLIKHSKQVKRQLVNGILQTLPEESQEMLLAQQIDKDPLLHELITKKVLILAISSSTYQNLNAQVKAQVVPKAQIFLSSSEMPLLYLSEGKIKAFEDCITFFPALFKLTKSIVVSEALTTQTLSDNSTLGGQDVTSDIQLQLRNGIKDPQLLAKLQTLVGNDDISLDLDEREDTDDFRQRGTIRVKTSKKLKQLIMQRETLRLTSSLQKPKDHEEGGGGLFQNKDESHWLDKVNERQKAMTKKRQLLSSHNKVLYNFGVLQDFFNYSAMSIQSSMHEVDIANPPTVKTQDDALFTLKQEMFDSKAASTGKSNIFAIAKVGLPNLILPSSLDIKLSNYNQYSSYLQLSDSFFPNLSQSQHSVLVFRPLIVKNGLNDFLVQILKINEFTILKRKVRMLTKAEVSFLAEQEAISDEKCEMYYNIMMESSCEIVVVTKLGAVSDLKTLADGSAPLGRRRVPQLDEDSSVVRTNVDAVNSMFEITPFSSMSEFLDLEDFIVSHSKLDKYKKLYKKHSTHAQNNRLNDQLYFFKIESIRKELNLFSRYFNLVAHAPSTESQAQQEMCILMPEVAIIEEVIVMLNPIYGSQIESAERLLHRMGFKVLNRKQITLSEEEATELFKEKMIGNTSFSLGDAHNISYSSTGGEKMVKFITGSSLEVWHLSKVSGEREIRELFNDAQIELDDLFMHKVRSTPFKPMHLPFLFLFMDSPYMFETAFRHIWGQSIAEVTGQQLIDGFDFKQRYQVLELALQMTVGDKVKELTFDKQGNFVASENLQGKDSSHSFLNHSKIPQIFQLYGNPKGSSAVHSIVESDSHGLYEIRFTRLPNKGDFYNLALEPQKLDLQKLKVRYFTKFQAINMYYNEVNKYFHNVCPAFYRFKISPLISQGHPGSDILNRVYEVEEYMGRLFIEEVANMHQDHIRTIKHQAQGFGRAKSYLQIMIDSEQKSLPPYIWGSRLAKMCTDLQQLKGSPDVKGAGRIQFEDQKLTGEVKDQKDYFNYDKKRFTKYLEDFKKGWTYYLSALECDLIETKIRRILESQTFKHTRQPNHLRMIPDRMNEINLRISEKVQLLIEHGLESESSEKFYKHLKQDMVDPASEERTVNMVQSLMHTLYLDKTHVGAKQRRFENHNAGRGFKVEDLEKEKALNDKKKEFSIHKDCAVVGIEVARRPKYQLIASVMYYINFWLRRVDRKTEMFDDIERQYKDEMDPESSRLAEAVYDQVLDTMITSIKENYGKDEVNYALDMVALNEKLALETDFERNVREKQELEHKMKQALEAKIDQEMRIQRSQMSLEELLTSISSTDSRDEERRQQEALRSYVKTKGGQDHHGEGFLGVLQQTQAYMGPYSIKMASDFLKMIERQKSSQQEKISFVKMEYFLYAVSDAHRCVIDLKQMEARINKMQDELEYSQADIAGMGTVIPGYFKNKAQAADYQLKVDSFTLIQKNLEQLRYQISMKETELVMIFRELMSWDIYVPDFYFDKELLLDLQKKDQLKETYQLPIRTFWRPVYFEAYKEPDIMKQMFATRLRDFSQVVGKPINPGSESERQHKPRQGVLVSALRPYVVKHMNDYLKFDKLYSKAEFQEQKELEKVKTNIDRKLTRDVKDYGQRFQPQI